MTDPRRLRALRIVLVLTAVAFMGLYGLILIWPAGWAWGHGHSHHEMMIVGVYAILGVFLIRAARDPEAHRSLIWFTVWSSAAHAAIMTLQALGDPMERGHFVGDVPALFVVALALGLLMSPSKAA